MILASVSSSGPTVPRRLLLPSVFGSAPPVEPAAAPDMLLLATELYLLIRVDPDQRRDRLAWDQRLADIAALRVADMQLRHYFAHVSPDGRGPNRWLWDAGILLPPDYDRDANSNQVESLTNNSDHSADAWAELKASPPHAAHLLGRGWFHAQSRMGVACGKDYEDDNWFLWCVLSVGD